MYLVCKEDLDINESFTQKELFKAIKKKNKWMSLIEEYKFYDKFTQDVKDKKEKFKKHLTYYNI